MFLCLCVAVLFVLGRVGVLLYTHTYLHTIYPSLPSFFLPAGEHSAYLSPAMPSSLVFKLLLFSPSLLFSMPPPSHDIPIYLIPLS